ncbi:MAG: DUF5696 domain-containing protein, partial [Oscillospiraceae bacterium]|nr:DUF5696 domain-containing protein [Oscillospiraceae bacterium]
MHKLKRLLSIAVAIAMLASLALSAPASPDPDVDPDAGIDAGDPDEPDDVDAGVDVGDGGDVDAGEPGDPDGADVDAGGGDAGVDAGTDTDGVGGEDGDGPDAGGGEDLEAGGVDDLATPPSVPTDPFAGYFLVAENARFKMYFNDETTDIAIDDSLTKMWTTYPSAESLLDVPAGVPKNTIMSHLYVHLTRGDRVLDSYAMSTIDSSRQRGLTTDYIDGGIRLNYDFPKQQHSFKISIEFTLKDDYLEIRLPADMIEVYNEDSSVVLNMIRVLPFFGATEGHDQDGYLLIPDGPGALIEFSKKLGASNPERIMTVYGSDDSTPQKDSLLPQERSRLPYFGIVDQGYGLFAIIESAEQSSEVIAAAGKGNSDSYVNATKYYMAASRFIYQVKQEIYLFKGQIIQTGNGFYSEVRKPMISNKILGEDYVVRYYFTKDEKADYNEFAGIYRDYLIAEKGYKDERKGEVVFNLGLLGAYDIKDNVAGIPTLILKPLTTFDQARTICEALKSGGVDNINLRMYGYNGGGYKSYVESRVDPEGKLGGARRLRDLIDYAKKEGINLFLSSDINEAWKNGRGFSGNRNSVRELSNGLSLQYEWSILHPETTISKGWYLVSPRFLKGYAESFLKSAADYGVRNLAFDKLGEMLYGDFRKNDEVPRDMAQRIYLEIFRYLSENTDRLMVSAGNAYALPYVTDLINVPDESSRYVIVTRDVPFTQLVIHGTINYSAYPGNYRYNKAKQFLRCIEYGSAPYYEWIYEESSIMKKSTLNDMYSANYADWLDEAIAEYLEFKSVFGTLA